MVEYRNTALDETFAALADPTRRAILSRLMRGDARVTEIAAPFDMSLNAVSKHVKVLERAGLVRRSVRGREHRLALIREALAEAGEWIAAQQTFWDRRLDALESHLKAKKTRKREKESPA